MVDVSRAYSGLILLNHVTIKNVANRGGKIPYGIRIYDNRTNIKIQNSILANISQGNSIQTYGTPAVDLDHVLFFNNLNATMGDGITNNTSFYADPGFSPDGYHILSSSAAINQAMVTSLTTDIDGDIRDTSPDIGADEYRPRWYVLLPVMMR